MTALSLTMTGVPPRRRRSPPGAARDHRRLRRGDGGYGDRLEILDEGPDRITLRVRYRSNRDGMRPLTGLGREVGGELERPGGDRDVVGQDGVILARQ